MNTRRITSNKWSFYLITLTLLVGFILSVVSFLELCSEECKASHNWTLFGLPFAPVGMAFFFSALSCQVFSFRYPILKNLVGFALVGALGTEVVLVLIQKYKIGHWCPVCLGIAAAIFVGTLSFLIVYFQELKLSLSKGAKGDFMKSISTGISTLVIFLAGFSLAFIGAAKDNPLAAMEKSIKDEIAFGNLNSPIQAYLFTDWACPACRSLEGKLKLLWPALTTHSRLVFVDLPVHPQTLNYSPYNLSFMINNKQKYLDLRDGLTQLSEETGTPNDKQVEEIAKKNGSNYREIHYSDVALGLKYWKDLATQFEVDATPILIIVNPVSKKGKKLAGVEEITEGNINKAIDALK